MKAEYQTGFNRWRASDRGFAGWQLDGVVRVSDGSLQLDRMSARPDRDPYTAGAYHERNFYNGGTFFVGEVTSPLVTPRFAFSEVIASWNATAPGGTWLEALTRVQFNDRWSRWYSLGVWAADDSTIQRHSIDRQDDEDGRVSVDTWLTTHDRSNALQLKLRLYSVDGRAVPIVYAAALAYSTTPVEPAALKPGNSDRWNCALNVPRCSQMVYPDGGEVWCSPTCVAMVLGYWTHDIGPCEPRVRATVSGVYDWVFDGHGNWPFNTAYAATQNMEAYVTRFTSLRQAEEWIAAGVPVIASIAWNNNLTNAPIPSSNGHLMVLAGFDAEGNPVMHDPAAASHEDVRRTYNRSEFEALWLQSSGGTVYLIYPPGYPAPDQ